MEVTAVVGGGISGLSIAYRLKQSGKDVTVFESAPDIGGKIGTINRNGFELDLGPITCSETPSLQKLISDLGIADKVTSASSASSIRYIYSKDRIHRVGPHPLKILGSSLLSFGGKLGLLKDLFSKNETNEDESVSEFVKRHFGVEALNKLFNPVLNGIYAGDCERLSIKSTMTLVKRMAVEHKSVIKGLKKEKDKLKPRRIISLDGGMKTLTDALSSALGNSIQTNSVVTGTAKTTNGIRLAWQTNGKSHEKEFAQVIFTTPSSVTASVIENMDKELADILQSIRYSNVTQVYCEVELGTSEFDGFGFLVPHEEQLSLLGAICISNIFPQKAQEGKFLFALFVGGDRPYDLDPSVKMALTDFARIVKPNSINILHTQEWNPAIPQFEVGHSKKLERIKALSQRHRGLVIAGNFVSGVSIGDCVGFDPLQVSI